MMKSALTKRPARTPTHAHKRQVLMATLYKRATPSQRRILRAVEGAVKNYADAHVDFPFTPRVARSIAKRAAGTLTAQWPDVLAARFARSERAEKTPGATIGTPGSQTVKGSARGASQLSRRSPLIRIWKELSWRVGAARKARQTERAETLVEILRVVASIQRAHGQQVGDSK